MAEDIRFTIAGETLSYPADMAPYMACWKAGLLASMETSLQFIRQYRGLGSLRKFCEDGYDAGRMLIARAVKDAVQRAVDAGHYDINETAFTALDGEERLIRPWQEAFQQVYDQFVDLETEKLGEEERRRIRKDMRGRFTGGGFGLDAAIWASLEAGAVNLVTGAAHSVFNALGNLVTSVRISGKESDIYNNPDTLRALVKALDRCVREAFVRILPQRVLGLSPSGVSREDLQRAAGIMDNIRHGRIPQDKEPRLLLEVLRAMPVDRRAYAALAPHLTAFADRMALEEMKRFFLIPGETLAREAVSSALDGDSPADTEFFRRAVHGDWNAAALCGTELAVDGGRADEGMDLLWAAYAAGSADAFAAFLALRKQGRDVPFFPELLQRRADEGNPQALLALGRMYAAGKDGLPQDPKKAKDYFLRCFRGNDTLRRADAACGLARLAATPEEAESYLEAAAEGGRKDAAAALAARYTDKGHDLRAFHFLALFLSLPKEESFAPDREEHIAFTGQAPAEASAALSLGLVFDRGAEAIADALDGLYDAPVLKPDKRRAAACYTRAARGGCPAAARLLAALLEEDGQPEDARRALEDAARAGDGEAAHRLGALYSADGPDRDAEKAIAAYRASLAAGHGEDALPLARLYEETGQADEAAELYRRAADGGDAEAALWCARRLDRDGADFDTLREALGYYMLAAAHHPEAALRAGVMYDEGLGTPPNASRAFLFYNAAAVQGSAEGALRLARKYRTGDGTPRDGEAAIRAYEEARRLGSTDAAWELATLFVEKRQPARARAAYRALAEQGSEKAARLLADLTPPESETPPEPKKKDKPSGGFFRKWFR